MTPTTPTTAPPVAKDPAFLADLPAGFLASFVGEVGRLHDQKRLYRNRLAAFERLPAWRRWLAGGNVARWYYREVLMDIEVELFELHAQWS